jgi:tetraacyldisaccharide 4'-kinase
MQSTLLKMTGKRPMIICSEKDAARLRHNPYLPEDWKSHLYYLPMQVHFMFNRNEQFDNLIMKHITLMESGKILMVNG